MHTLNDHKKMFEKLVVDTLIQGLEQDKLNEQQLPEISKFVLEKIDNIADHQQLVNLATELTSRWPVFVNIEQMEKGEEKQVLERQVAHQVLKKIEEGQAGLAIEQAAAAIKPLPESEN